MKTVLKGVLLFLGTFSAMVNADFLGDADDTYLGFQMTASIDSKYEDLISNHSQYNLLLLQQGNGVKHGVALTRGGDGMRILNYLAPSADFEIGTSRVADYAVPIMRLDAEAGIESYSSASSNAGALAALVALGAWIKIKHDLEKSWKPASPD